MGNQLWTGIKVGGKAPRAVWEKMLEALDDYMHENRPPANIDDALGKPIDVAGETRGGQASPITELCRTLGITYRRWCDGELEAWAPGWDAPVFRPMIEGEPAITLSDLRAALKAGRLLTGLILELDGTNIEVPPVEIEAPPVGVP